MYFFFFSVVFHLLASGEGHTVKAGGEGRAGDISWSPTQLLHARTVGATPASPPVTNHPGIGPENPDQQAISFPSLCLRRSWKPAGTWPWEVYLVSGLCPAPPGPPGAEDGLHLAHLWRQKQLAHSLAASIHCFLGGRPRWRPEVSGDVLVLRGSEKGSREFV